ncbi:MAG: dienelactone hydrolase family protein [Thermomicrobiales bacterium]
MCHAGNPAPAGEGLAIEETMVEVRVGDLAIPAFLATPGGEGRHPAVLVLHDIHGVNPFYEDLTRRLAAEGFVAMLPDLFVRQGPLAEKTPDATRARRALLDQRHALDDIARAIETLAGHARGDGTVGTIGFCMGGTFAMLAAAREPVPDASVAFYGFPAPSPTERAPLLPLAEANSLRSPLLALWGDQDHAVGMDTVEAYRAALAEADRQFEFVVYPGVGHGFLTFDPDSPTFTVSEDAWTRTLAFLREVSRP